MTTLVPGHTYFSGTYNAPAVKKTSNRRLVVVWVLAIAVVAAGLVMLSGALEKPSARYVCPPDCGRPPIGEPVTANPRFTSADGAFSVSYPAAGAAYKVTTATDSVTDNLLVNGQPFELNLATLRRHVSQVCLPHGGNRVRSRLASGEERPG